MPVCKSPNEFIVCHFNALLSPSHLDQLVYIPLPGEASHASVLKAVPNKSPVVPEVNLQFLAKNTHGYCACVNLPEIFRRAVEVTIRDDTKMEEDLEEEDLVLQMTKFFSYFCVPYR